MLKDPVALKNIGAAIYPETSEPLSLGHLKRALEAHDEWSVDNTLDVGVAEPRLEYGIVVGPRPGIFFTLPSTSHVEAFLFKRGKQMVSAAAEKRRAAFVLYTGFKYLEVEFGKDFIDSSLHFYSSESVSQLSAANAGARMLRSVLREHHEDHPSGDSSKAADAQTAIDRVVRGYNGSLLNELGYRREIVEEWRWEILAAALALRWFNPLSVLFGG